MKSNIEIIVEEYLQSKRTKDGKDFEFFRNRLREMGVSEDRLQDLLIKMDDEWTNEQFAVAKIKNSKTNFVAGIILFATGIILSVLGWLGYLTEGKIVILFYGAIGGGFVLAVNANRIIKTNQGDLERRKIMWKHW